MCNLSPALFNIYVEVFLRNWKHKADAGIMLKINLFLNTLLLADDQVIIQTLKTNSRNLSTY